MLGARLISRRSFLAFGSSRLLIANNTRIVGSAAASTLSFLTSSHPSASMALLPNTTMIRTMASKKKKKGSGNPKQRPIEFMVQGLDDTFEECEAADFNKVMKQVAQAYQVMPGELSNGTYTMQVGNEYGDWQDLQSFQQLKEAANEEEYPSIRIKELAEQDQEDDMDEYNDDIPDYDEKDYPWDKDDGMMGGGGGGGDEAMKQTLIELVEALQADGWRLAKGTELQSLDEFKLSKENSGEEMSARALVVKYAKDLPDLQDQLVMKIGSFDHIVQCLQFGFMWEPENQQQQQEEEESRDEEQY